jgi:hypothetical protein
MRMRARSPKVVPTVDRVVDLYSGAIYTSRQLVFNPLQPVVYLVVSAADHGTPSRSTSIALEVQVVDVNDHAPAFVWPSYR